MEVFVERPGREFRSMRAAQVGVSARGRTRKVTIEPSRLRIERMLRACETAELLRHLSFPARDVADELFETAQRAFAPAVVDRLGNVDAAAALIERRDHASCNEVADIRY